MTVGRFIKAFRECDEVSQTAYAKRLGISKANLCDIEKGRKLVSVERAAKFAKVLGVSETVLVQLSLQDQLRQAKLKLKVEVHAA
jgi:transcriptional regulator with XRE-family HTH domain